MAIASLSQTFDTTCSEIITTMDKPIENGDRTKLTRKELEELISILMAQLVAMNALGVESARLHG
ncbi:hypothetical protein [Phormidium tenue]|uniref:Uncharacterized protein n=1 Tax=Phormidium tenue NIES-30 TaxID=549789 RepID=A0A1U7J233_9CYAN|nr:hypothetical protein [Phormidium tenue]MBD2233744.1 hypothetical protein [Phormidium tenue FACHB-1052]OKH46160.1 hypothetical protein NIES30_17855 [Phormidium tenue NIES-30]